MQISEQVEELRIMKSSRYILTGFSLSLLLVILCYGQEKVRTVNKITTKDEPIALIGSEVGSKVFNPENQILAGQDWLQYLKLDLKNISNKTIIYMKVELKIERQGRMEYPLRLPLFFGKQPDNSSLSPNLRDTSQVELLKPGESVKLSLKPNYINASTKFLRENGIEDIENVKIFFELVLFDDGTGWAKGNQLRRNAKNNNQFEVINSSLQEHNQLDLISMITKSWQGINTKHYLSDYPSFFLQAT